ncbi:hypothetical protein KQI84_16170 [bacterium]|nr:hypothetical protein [bacterium]
MKLPHFRLGIALSATILATAIASAQYTPVQTTEQFEGWSSSWAGRLFNYTTVPPTAFPMPNSNGVILEPESPSPAGTEELRIASSDENTWMLAAWASSPPVTEPQNPTAYEFQTEADTLYAYRWHLSSDAPPGTESSQTDLWLNFHGLVPQVWRASEQWGLGSPIGPNTNTRPMTQYVYSRSPAGAILAFYTLDTDATRGIDTTLWEIDVLKVDLESLPGKTVLYNGGGVFSRGTGEPTPVADPVPTPFDLENQWRFVNLQTERVIGIRGSGGDKLVIAPTIDLEAQSFATWISDGGSAPLIQNLPPGKLLVADFWLSSPLADDLPDIMPYVEVALISDSNTSADPRRFSTVRFDSAKTGENDMALEKLAKHYRVVMDPQIPDGTTAGFNALIRVDLADPYRFEFQPTFKSGIINIHRVTITSYDTVSIP